MYNTSNIANILQGEVHGTPSYSISHLAVDSRKIFFPEETLFFAIQTERRDGHSFIKETYDQGVRCFVISNRSFIGNYKDAVFILVSNTLSALQSLAAFHRGQFNIPVVGITGSNGKTIVKEWLNIMLEDKNIVVRSPKSYNSQIGVPLSVWQMASVHTVGIFEAGISKPGEMEQLEKIIRPTIGILTNIGAAHDEGFTSRKQKLEEKLKLFIHSDILICNTDDELIRPAVEGCKKFSWGKRMDCDVQVIEQTMDAENVKLRVQYKGHEHTFQLLFYDEASIENALHCICFLLYAGIDPSDINRRLKGLHPVEMRLEWKKAINRCYLLNDSYSNDLSSLMIALNYLEQQAGSKKRTVIISDFYESGLRPDELYSSVSGLLGQHGVARLFIVGTEIRRFRELFEKAGMQVEAFNSTSDFVTALPGISLADEAILLKGARKFGFEQIALLLEEQVHQTVLEINLTALRHNLQEYRQMLKPGIKMMVMVKAFGYGSGDAEVASLLQYQKVDYLAVAYADEGVTLRKAGIHLPIMVMNPEITSFEAIEHYNLEPEIYSFELLEAFENYCRMQGINQYPVHIKLDTGMHRLGFLPVEVKALGKQLKSQTVLVVKSAFTHFAGSENMALDEFTRQQGEIFQEACQELEKILEYPFIRHADNTAGIRRHPELHFEMVRLGIGLYGIDDRAANLMVVSTLKTTVAQVKTVPAGETVGYGRMGKADHDITIATIRIGYADGFRRKLGNGTGGVFLNGKIAPVIGNVSMDMTMIDITGLGPVKAGDIVEVFGNNLPIQTLALQCETIPYEILTGISQRVKRVYVEE